jgi:hypothetical protein
LKGTTIAACLLALSRELRTLERLFRQIAQEEACNGFGDARLPRAMAANLASLARRAEKPALLALQSDAGGLDPLLGLPTQPASSARRN